MLRLAIKYHLLITIFFLFSCNTTQNSIDINSENNDVSSNIPLLTATMDNQSNSIKIYLKGSEKPILTQNAGTNFRPYIHPIVSPDGNSNITEYSPSHHKHQTGLYWGFKGIKEKLPLTDKQLENEKIIIDSYKSAIDEIDWYGIDEELARTKYEALVKEKDTQLISNGIDPYLARDYFHHPTKDFYGDSTEYWNRKNVIVLRPKSTDSDPSVKWRTVYDLLDKNGETLLTETLTWNLKYKNESYFIDVHWEGFAQKDLIIEEHEYSPLFLRMPWKEGVETKVINAVRNKDQAGEGKRAVWLDIAMKLNNSDDFVHVAMFDHAENINHPQPWRVDNEFGVGPAPTRLGDWIIKKHETQNLKYQLIVYQGDFNDIKLTEYWSDFAQEDRWKERNSTTSGERSAIAYSQWGLASEEGRNAKFLTPEEALNVMTVHEDFNVNLFASEPMMRQPMAFCWDNKGRLWIAENMDMFGSGNGIHVTKESRILILEDTDNDGVADSKKVFVEGLVFPSAIAVGFDGLWVGAPPNLLFIPDKNNDDKADVEDIEIRLTGWGDTDLHETLNSFNWGPDGWLYGVQGVFTPSNVGKPAGKSKVFEFNQPYPGKDEFGKEVLNLTPEQQKKYDEIEYTLSLKMDEFTNNFMDEKGNWLSGAGVKYEEILSWKTEAIKAAGIQKLPDDWWNKIDELADILNPNIEYADEPVPFNAGVFRYHPIKDRFEVVAHGTSNPWGLDFDSKGQIFTTACVIPHLWHIVPGGLYHRQASSHFNENAYDDIRTITNHRHRSAHGGARIYQSDAFPDEYHGQIFMGNIHEHALLSDKLTPKGSSFVGSHGEDLLIANNAQFVGFSTEIGPDGSIYMLDWHDAEICGDTVRTRDTGRIYRISPKNSQAENWDGRFADLDKLDDIELANLQLSKSSWHSRRAQLILQKRASKTSINPIAVNKLFDIFNSSKNSDHRLRALWSLHVTNNLNEIQLTSYLSDPDEHVRAWSIQLLTEDFDVTNTTLNKFVQMSKNDSSPVVRLYLASALQRIEHDNRWDIAHNLVSFGVDSDDPNIPFILWYGIEPILSSDPDRAMKIASNSKINKIKRFIARRLTVDNKLFPVVEEIQNNKKDRNHLLLGIRDALEGFPEVTTPKNWSNTYQTLRLNQGESSDLALDISILFGDKLAAETLVAFLSDERSPTKDQIKAIKGLATQKRVELSDKIPFLINNKKLRAESIRSVAYFDSDELAYLLLENYPNYNQDEKLEILHVLASRPNYGTILLEAIENEEIPRGDIPTYLARLMLRTVGNRFLATWGPVEGISPDMEKSFSKYRTLLTSENLSNANISKGRGLYQNSCGSCHMMYGEGGNVGPDLTGANRGDIEYLLGNILTPSAVVKENYKMTMISTEDGQYYSGVIEGENDRQISLRIPNVDEPVTIPKSIIWDRETANMSMMPEGLLQYLSDDDVIDLIGYLQNFEDLSSR